MISPADQRIHNSIRSLKAEIKDLEARLQDQDRQIRPKALKSASQRMFLSAERVNELIWSSYH
jgi:hypothetical protein